MKNIKILSMSYIHSGIVISGFIKFGMCSEKAVENSGERVVFIASGDLSHRLSESGPYGFD